MSTSFPVFRFAPSPNGEMHLGHAYSALMNLRLARKIGGKILLRIEDIDTQRCTRELEKQMLEDLEWIGFEWDERPVRQSENYDQYRTALEQLEQKGLVYPTCASRSTIRKLVVKLLKKNADWPFDPDGTPHYPGNERDFSPEEWKRIKQSGDPYSLRLAMSAALDPIKDELSWTEFEGTKKTQIPAEPSEWGDVVLARKDAPASYHLCCAIDDAAQGVTHIVRGSDLYHATSIHRLLQELLEFPLPMYQHHKLILDEDGAKLSKSLKSTGLRCLRERGLLPEDVLELISRNAFQPVASSGLIQTFGTRFPRPLIQIFES